MRYQVINACLKKEFTELVRGKMIFYVFFVPFMILILFGYGIKMDVTHTRTLILDHDKSKFSYELISKFAHSRYFNLEVLDISEQEALHKIKKNETDMIIIIPESFEKRILQGQKKDIGIFVDGSFPTRGKTTEGYAKGVIYDFMMEKMARFQPDLTFITINQRNLFNQAMGDKEMIVPGLISLVLLIAPAILSALLIVKEKERGTIFNFYASPVSKKEFLTAKLLPPFILHSINIILLWFVSIYIFGVPFRGSFILYLSSSMIYIIISISIGLLVSIISSTQIVALILTLLITIIPGFLYSGMIMPVSSMDYSAYVIAHIYPVMYHTRILYDTFLIGDGLNSLELRKYLFILIIYALSLISIGYLLIRKRIS